MLRQIGDEDAYYEKAVVHGQSLPLECVEDNRDAVHGNREVEDIWMGQLLASLMIEIHDDDGLISYEMRAQCYPRSAKLLRVEVKESYRSGEHLVGPVTSDVRAAGVYLGFASTRSVTQGMGQL